MYLTVGLCLDANFFLLPENLSNSNHMATGIISYALFL